MAQPANTRPPELVDVIGDKEPSTVRERRVEVDGSNENDELSKRSKPANEPARPTIPIRSKSIFGNAAETTWPAQR